MGVDFRSTDRDDQPVRGDGRRLGIICARWNDVITRRMLTGVLDRARVGRRGRRTTSSSCGCRVRSRSRSRPRRWPPPGRFDAVIALGCVIRGDTAHFEYVAGPAAEGILEAQLDTGVPIVFGVLTVENRRQALVRSVVDGDVVGDNKGAEAAETALQMIEALEQIRQGLSDWQRSAPGASGGCEGAHHGQRRRDVERVDPGAIGTRTAASHASMVSAVSPGPSAPTTSATGPSSRPSRGGDVHRRPHRGDGVSATVRMPSLAPAPRAGSRGRSARAKGSRSDQPDETRMLRR